MKLEYLDLSGTSSEFSNTNQDDLVRLYDFDKTQARELALAINQIILIAKKSLELNQLEFIEGLNCRLVLRLGSKDIGITTTDKYNFYCDLTTKGYVNMISLLEPFWLKESHGYQWLYDLNNDIEFLISPNGHW